MIGLRFFPLKSADVRGAGTREEPLKTSAWEANLLTAPKIIIIIIANFLAKKDLLNPVV